MSLRVREVNSGRFRVERRRWFSCFWRPVLLKNSDGAWSLAEYSSRRVAEDVRARAARILAGK